jgi:uroporphyrinogen decarboxylase
MTTSPRERMLKAFRFDHPDKLPVFYHPCTAGLYVHGQKLLDLLRAYPPDNWIEFDGIPQPRADAFDPDGSFHEFCTDAWGTRWEYRIFGIAGQPRSFPLDEWSALETLQFPALPNVDADQIARQKENHLAWSPVGISLFERLFEMRPMEKLLIDLVEESPDLLRFMDRLMDWYRRGIARALAAGADVFPVGDDWGTQNSLLVSPAVFRRLFKPRIAELVKPIREAGKIIMYHSCGAVEPLFDDLVELGINGFWHQIALYDPEKFARRAAEAGVLLFLHMDRQHLVPRGTPAQIRAAVKHYAGLHKALGGGAMFYVEIENDAPFENVEALVTSIYEYR